MKMASMSVLSGSRLTCNSECAESANASNELHQRFDRGRELDHFCRPTNEDMATKRDHKDTTQANDEFEFELDKS